MGGLQGQAATPSDPKQEHARPLPRVPGPVGRALAMSHCPGCCPVASRMVSPRPRIVLHMTSSDFLPIEGFLPLVSRLMAKVGGVAPHVMGLHAPLPDL